MFEIDPHRPFDLLVDDMIRYRIMYVYTEPIFSFSQTVPCRCSSWRTRIARFLGRHPRTHRIPRYPFGLTGV